MDLTRGGTWLRAFSSGEDGERELGHSSPAAARLQQLKTWPGSLEETQNIPEPGGDPWLSFGLRMLSVFFVSVRFISVLTLEACQEKARSAQRDRG